MVPVHGGAAEDKMAHIVLEFQPMGRAGLEEVTSNAVSLQLEKH